MRDWPHSGDEDVVEWFGLRWCIGFDYTPLVSFHVFHFLSFSRPFVGGWVCFLHGFHFHWVCFVYFDLVYLLLGAQAFYGWDIFGSSGA